jgi:hypothetical protein
MTFSRESLVTLLAGTLCLHLSAQSPQQVLRLPRFPVQQSLVAAKGHSYDVLQVTDPKSGEKVSVYFNIDAFYPSREFAK